MTQKTLPYEEGAEHRTGLSGWVCKTCRRFFGEEEHLARYCCAKDRPCQTEGCKNRTPSAGYIICDSCQETNRLKRWLALPEVAWDGETPLCLDDDDRYFFDADQLADYLADEEVKLEDLRLVICEKERPPRFDMTDFLCDHIPEDMDIDNPEEIEQAVEDWIKAHVPDIWVAGKTRPTQASVLDRVVIA